MKDSKFVEPIGRTTTTSKNFNWTLEIDQKK